MLTVNFLREIFSYDPATGIFTWNVREGIHKSWNTKYAGKETGSLDAYGYLVLRINGKTYKAHRVAWAYVTGDWPPTEIEIDHKNGIRSFNAFKNLRLANDQQNAVNAKIRKDNKSGAKGVSWHHRNQKWQAQINEDGRRTSLGYFNTVEAAKVTYQKRAEQLYGEFVRAL
jgi:HNH endonuclease/AP2 domain